MPADDNRRFASHSVLDLGPSWISVRSDPGDWWLSQKSGHLLRRCNKRSFYAPLVHPSSGGERLLWLK